MSITKKNRNISKAPFGGLGAALFINGIGCISPQRTFNNAEFLPDVKEYTTNRMVCVDADYSKFFDAGSIRRMGRLMKYGTAAGLIALRDAGITAPGAISTGTGLGLPASYSIIQSHKGDIRVESQVNKGTEFIISLNAEK